MQHKQDAFNQNRTASPLILLFYDHNLRPQPQKMSSADKKGVLRGPSWSFVALRGSKGFKVFSAPLRAPPWTKKVFFLTLHGPSWIKGVQGVLRAPPCPSVDKKGVLRVPSWPFVDQRGLRCSPCPSVPLRAPPCPSADKKGVLPAPSRPSVDQRGSRCSPRPSVDSPNDVSPLNSRT